MGRANPSCGSFSSWTIFINLCPSCSSSVPPHEVTWVNVEACQSALSSLQNQLNARGLNQLHRVDRPIFHIAHNYVAFYGRSWNCQEGQKNLTVFWQAISFLMKYGCFEWGPNGKSCCNINSSVTQTYVCVKQIYRMFSLRKK